MSIFDKSIAPYKSQCEDVLRLSVRHNLATTISIVVFEFFESCREATSNSAVVGAQLSVFSFMLGEEVGADRFSLRTVGLKAES